jgi:hypothetical protein
MTRDRALSDFVFEMNDWLLGVQQWDAGPGNPDVQGRFYDPGRPFGPPHASSTGVYLEGLIDAHTIALAIGDSRRAESYRMAILRGLRSVMQLQFDQDLDLYYVRERDRDRVRGGIRTEVYDNRIRCDNVQHTLMAVLDILDRWRDAQFAVDPARRFASGEIDVHPSLAERAPAGGDLRLRLIRLSDGHVMWTRRTSDVKLPLSYEVPRAELGRAADAEMFLEVTYRAPAGQGGTVVRGEAWGGFGKPSPIEPGQRVDVSLGQLADTAGAPPVHAREVDVDPDNPVLVEGVIRPHPDLPIAPGGFIHLRLMSLELGRPFAFLRVEDVQFPLEFSIRAKDQFYPRAMERASQHRFYIDVTYDPPGLSAEYGLFHWQAPAVSGNAWGGAGPPSSLRMGDRVEIALDRYWTRPLLRGRLERWPEARAEGWIFVPPSQRDPGCSDNRLTLALRSPRGTQQRLLAAKVYEDIDPTRPVAYHLVDADFLRHPIDPGARAYFSAWLECFEGGRRTSMKIGGRASPETPISAFPHTLRIALAEPATEGPETSIGDVGKLAVSRPTYR